MAHASGEREEQWELRPDCDDWMIVATYKGGERVVADELTKADVDAILAARALAGLAQRYREAAALISDPAWRVEQRAHGLSAGDGAAVLLDPINRDYDALTAGREAAAE